MRKRNFMLSVLICSSMITANVVPAFAYNLEGNGLKGGVENVTYYVDSSASGLKNKISLAASSWNGTDTPVYLKNVTSSSKSVVDIYYTNSAFSSSDNRNGIVAQTTYIPDSKNYWTNAKIEVNPTVYDNLTLSDTHGTPVSDAQQGTLAHEMGHAMGLAHNFDADVLMNQLGGGRKVYTPQADDQDGINSLYNYRSSKIASVANEKSKLADMAIREESTTSSAVSISNPDFKYLVSTEENIKTYNNFEELTNDSNTIIQGEVIDVKPYFNEYGIYSNVKIKVIDSLAGSLKNGDIINTTIYGGVLEGKDAKEFRKEYMRGKNFDGSKLSSSRVEQISDDLDNLKKGDESLLFLNYANNKYSLTGSHQGRFKITDDMVETHKEFEHSDKALKAMNASNSIKDIKNLILKIKQK
ncbi:matrixin family metalloprotease [Clostridium beijerinckii]|uniref:matrixin family metalloprotease n=1 Tax=Clostridium beijerinckii TaxID=1520 RepID=UPI00098CA757|nr:matrixin family metalloprotease [Clostridium beijerinckii]MBA8937823.1 hypothetical protein [Clostridium beijerinckii]OOM64856.1 matrixin [Clostridium beijerinckii]CUU51201.1 putative Peptidase M10A and M12B matrixin and adamalysin [Clostridium beijerinckii]